MENNAGMLMSVVIAGSLNDEYIDLCTGLRSNDVLFARYPYKFFPLFESKTNSGIF
jgi:hypothetical protein